MSRASSSPTGPRVSTRSPRWSARTRTMSARWFSERVTAIVEPSGDQAGENSSPGRVGQPDDVGAVARHRVQVEVAAGAVGDERDAASRRATRRATSRAPCPASGGPHPTRPRRRSRCRPRRPEVARVKAIRCTPCFSAFASGVKTPGGQPWQPRVSNGVVEVPDGAVRCRWSWWWCPRRTARPSARRASTPPAWAFGLRVTAAGNERDCAEHDGRSSTRPPSRHHCEGSRHADPPSATTRR